MRPLSALIYKLIFFKGEGVRVASGHQYKQDKYKFQKECIPITLMLVVHKTDI